MLQYKWTNNCIPVVQEKYIEFESQNTDKKAINDTGCSQIVLGVSQVNKQFFKVHLQNTDQQGLDMQSNGQYLLASLGEQ